MRNKEELIEEINRIIGKDPTKGHALQCYFNKVVKARKARARSFWHTASGYQMLMSDLKTWPNDHLRCGLAYIYSYNPPKLHGKQAMIARIKEIENTLPLAESNDRFSMGRSLVEEARADFVEKFQPRLKRNTVAKRRGRSAIGGWDSKYLRNYERWLPTVLHKYRGIVLGRELELC